MPRKPKAAAEPSERTVLYNGRVVCDFFGSGSRHHYDVTVDGVLTKKVPSVTQATGVWDKSQPLMNWAINNTLDIVRLCIGPNTTYTQEELNEIFEKAKKRSHVLKKEAAEIGTLAHEWLSKYFRGENPALPNKEAAYRPCVDAALDWTKAHKIRFLHNERPIYSLRHKYSGRLDGIVEIDGVLGLLDFKTGNGIYEDMAMQIAAYNAAWEEEGGDRIEKRHIIRLGKLDGKFYEHGYSRATLDRDFAAFMGLFTAYSAAKEIRAEMKAGDWLEE